MNPFYCLTTGSNYTEKSQLCENMRRMNEVGDWVMDLYLNQDVNIVPY